MQREHAISYRRLSPSDLPALKMLHQAMFPVDYDEAFYRSATHGDDILGWAAVLPQALASLEMFPTSTTVFVNGEQLVGFITVKPFASAALPPADQRLLGLEDTSASVMYILTLGVAEVSQGGALLIQGQHIGAYLRRCQASDRGLPAGCRRNSGAAGWPGHFCTWQRTEPLLSGALQPTSTSLATTSPP